MKGNISISRFSGESSGISIELQDETSRVRVIRIELTPEQWGNAISGLSFQDCEFDLGNVAVVGMKREHKTVVVSIKGYSFTAEQKQAAVAPFEVDGWRARLDDLGNHHRAVGGEGFRVNFFRHVKP